MALNTDPPLSPWPGAVWSDCLGWVPAPVTFTQTWFGGEYPEGRGRPQPASGWQCPGCSRCYAPGIRQCGECGPKTLGERIRSADGCCSLNGCEDAER